jgi:ureidoacrylate peracid hydrolase
MSTMTRRELVGMGAAAGIAAVGLPHPGSRAAAGRSATMDARPAAVSFDPTRTAVIVVDMQNDFGSKGGMFDRAGIDVSGIQKAVAPTANALEAARNAGIRIVYLKMAYLPVLSDLGAPDSVNRVRHLQLGVGQRMTAPDGAASRILIRDTWNSDIVSEIEPHPDDILIYKTRFSGFYRTDLDERLQARDIRHLIITVARRASASSRPCAMRCSGTTCACCWRTA